MIIKSFHFNKALDKYLFRIMHNCLKRTIRGHEVKNAARNMTRVESQIRRRETTGEGGRERASERASEREKERKSAREREEEEEEEEIDRSNASICLDSSVVSGWLFNCVSLLDICQYHSERKKLKTNA
jgi:hypothetical protein